MIKNKEWVAFSCILGALAGLVLTNTGSNDAEAFLFWLVYSVTCGVVINTAEGLSSTLLLAASLPSPTCLTLVALYRLVFQGSTILSGIPFSGSRLDYLRLAVMWLGSVVAIWIFSHARPAVLKVFRGWLGMSKAKADKIEQRLNWVVKVAGTALLVGHIIVG